jgi:hypothetical protein
MKNRVFIGYELRALRSKIALAGIVFFLFEDEYAYYSG